MKTGYYLHLLLAALAVTASRASVYPYAEYHLGEAGSLSDPYKNPQDSSGSNLHFQSDFYNSGLALVSSSTSPAAIGSTASLDTSVPGDQNWQGYHISYNNTLPRSNFAFGIFVQSPALGASWVNNIFSLGRDERSLGIGLDNNGWRAGAYQAGFIPGQPGTFTPNTWVHLAVIRTGMVTRFYINGVDQGGTLTTEPVHGDPLMARSYSGNSGSSFEGLIDEARVVTFTEGETTATIIAALQAGAIPTAFIKVGGTAAYAKANLSPTEPSVFRIGGKVRDSVQILNADGLVVAGTAPQKHVIQISQEGYIAPGRYPLIAYSGSIGGQGFDGLELAAVPGRLTATLENNIANSTIDLVLSGPDGITWTGTGSNVWNLAAPDNWILNGTNTAASFQNLDHVTFNDSTAAAVNAITIAENVTPGSMKVDASENYTFSGAGISGSGALTKSGTGTLTLANDNSTHTGAISINAGVLSVGDGGADGSLGSGEIFLNGGQLTVNRSGDDVRLPNALTGSGGIRKLGAGRLILGSSTPTSLPYFTGPVAIDAGEVVAGANYCLGRSPGVTIAAGAAFDVAGFTNFNSITVSGSGPDGKGALKSNGAIVNNHALTGGVVLAADASLGGSTDWGLGNTSDGYPLRPSLAGDFKLTKVGNDTISFDETDISVKDIVIESGRLLADTGTAISNSPAGAITINGGSLDFGQNFFFPITCSKPIVLNGGTLSANGGPYVNISIPSPIQLNAPASTILAERIATMYQPDQPLPPAMLTLSGVVSGSGSLVMRGFGTVTLNQAPAYTGDTIVLGGDGDFPYFRGTLSLKASGLNDASSVKISTGRVLNLAFSGTDTVSKLFIGGVQQPAGVYDSSHPSHCITGTGSLTVTSSPVGTVYQLWENSHGIPGAGPDADSDQDGISNAIEFMIGSDPGSLDSASSALRPSITREGTNLVCVFRRTDISKASYLAKVSYSTDLTSNWITAQDGVGGVSIEEESEGFGPGIDKITVTIPATGKPKLFARLQLDAL